MNYPKMLYKGNQEKYQTVIADNEDHEAELVADDWLEYGELLGSEPEMKYASGVLGGSQKESTDGAQELVETKQALVVANEEIERLNQVITIGRAENADLREQLTFFQNEGPKLSASAGDQLAKDPNDYNELKIDELQALLDQKGIKYLKRDGKDTLIGLLNGHSN